MKIFNIFILFIFYIEYIAVNNHGKNAATKHHIFPTECVSLYISLDI